MIRLKIDNTKIMKNISKKFKGLQLMNIISLNVYHKHQRKSYLPMQKRSKIVLSTVLVTAIPLLQKLHQFIDFLCLLPDRAGDFLLATLPFRFFNDIEDNWLKKTDR